MSKLFHNHLSSQLTEKNITLKLEWFVI